MTKLIFKNIIKWNTTTLILLLLLTVPHPTYAWHEVTGPGDIIILKKDFHLAPERTTTIFKKSEKNKTFKCSLYAYASNKRTMIIKSGKQYEISSAREEANGRRINIKVEKKVVNGLYGFSLFYDCFNCNINQFSSDCGGLVTIIHKKAVEF